MTDCVFCRIINGDLSSDKVYEDDQVLAILDIAPVNAGHTLLMPKEHSADLLAVSPDDLSALTRQLPKLAKAVARGVSADGFNIGINNGSAAGQIVPHTHIHIIPRFYDDGYKSWGHKKYAAAEAAEVAQKIRSCLESKQ